MINVTFTLFSIKKIIFTIVNANIKQKNEKKTPHTTIPISSTTPFSSYVHTVLFYFFNSFFLLFFSFSFPFSLVSLFRLFPFICYLSLFLSFFFPLVV